MQQDQSGNVAPGKGVYAPGSAGRVGPGQIRPVWSRADSTVCVGLTHRAQRMMHLRMASKCALRAVQVLVRYRSRARVTLTHLVGTLNSWRCLSRLRGVAALHDDVRPVGNCKGQ